MNTTEVVIRASGDAVVRTITESPVLFPEQILQEYAKDVSLPLNAVADGDQLLPDHPDYISRVLAVADLRRLTWVIQLNTIIFRTPLRFVSEGVVSPNFAASTEDVAVEFNWEPILLDRGLTVHYALQTHKSGSVYKFGKNYLFAREANTGKCFRLPTGNVFEDCSICTGDDGVIGASHAALVRNRMEQFYRSNWNSDLFSRDMLNKAGTLFSFRPVPQGEGFEMYYPTPINWTSQCDKVSHALIEQFNGIITQAEQS